MYFLPTSAIAVVLLFAGQLSEGVGWSCPSGYTRHGSSCYRFNLAGYATWDAALADCRADGSNLLSLTDEATLQEVTDLVSSHPPGTNYWTAGTDERTEGSWVWDYLTPFEGNLHSNNTSPPQNDFTTWASSRWAATPLNNALANCAFLRKDYFQLRPFSCASSILNLKYICHWRPSSMCPPGYIVMGTSCIRVHETEMSYSDAEEACNAQNATLLEFQDLNFGKAVQTWLSDNNVTSAWMGIHVAESGLVSMKSSGRPVSFLFMRDSSADYTMGKCFTIIGEQPLAPGIMGSSNCSESRPFVCQYRHSPQCPPGFVSFTYDSRCFHVSSVPETRYISEQYCKSMDSALLRASGSTTMMKTLGSFLANQTNLTSSGFWTTGTSAMPNYWTHSTDGTGLIGLTWKGGSPNGTEGCVAGVNPSTTGLQYVVANCSEKQYYICEYQKEKPSCPPGYNLAADGTCLMFLFATTPGVNAYLPASIECSRYNGKLATATTSTLGEIVAFSATAEASANWVYMVDGMYNGSHWIDAFGMPLANVTNHYPTLPLGGAGLCLFASASNISIEAKPCSFATGYQSIVCEYSAVVNEANILAVPVDQGCYLDDYSNLEFKSVPSQISSKLTFDLCKQGCFADEKRYAGVAQGQFCFCSDTLRSRVLPPERCDAFCNGDASQTGPKCGTKSSRVIFSVSYTGGELKPPSIEPSNVTVTLVPTTHKHAIMVNINSRLPELAEFTGLRYDGSEGKGLTMPVKNTSVGGIIYVKPGRRIIGLMTEDSTGSLPDQAAYLEVALAEKVQPFDVVCPKIVLPYESITCNITVHYGGEMQMSIDYGNSTILPIYNVPDPIRYTVGESVPMFTTRTMLTSLGRSINYIPQTASVGRRRKRQVVTCPTPPRPPLGSWKAILSEANGDQLGRSPPFPNAAKLAYQCPCGSFFNYTPAVSTMDASSCGSSCVDIRLRLVEITCVDGSWSGVPPTWDCIPGVPGETYADFSTATRFFLIPGGPWQATYVTTTPGLQAWNDFCLKQTCGTLAQVQNSTVLASLNALVSHADQNFDQHYVDATRTFADTDMEPTDLAAIVTGMTTRTTFDAQPVPGTRVTGFGSATFITNTYYRTTGGGGSIFWVSEDNYNLLQDDYPNVGVAYGGSNADFIRLQDKILTLTPPFLCQAGCPLQPPTPPSTARRTNPIDEYHGYPWSIYSMNSIKAVYECPSGAVFSGTSSSIFTSNCVGKQGWEPSTIPDCVFPTTPAPNTEACISPPVPPVGMTITAIDGSAIGTTFTSGYQVVYTCSCGFVLSGTIVRQKVATCVSGNWTGLPDPLTCDTISTDQKLVTTSKTFYSIKTTSPANINVKDYAGMADFCWTQRCGALGQVANSNELQAIRNSVLLDGIFPVDGKNAIGRAGTRRYVYTGLTLRSEYNVTTISATQFTLYNGTVVNLTALHDPASPPAATFNSSMACLVLYDSMGDGTWYATEDQCTGAPNWMAPSPFICQAGCHLPPPAVPDPKITVISDPVLSIDSGAHPLMVTYSCPTGAVFDGSLTQRLVAVCLGKSGWNLTTVPYCFTTKCPVPDPVPGSLFTDSNGTELVAGTSYDIGSVVRLTCPCGKVISGTYLRFADFQCTKGLPSSWGIPAGAACVDIATTEYAALSDRRLYRIKSTDPTKVSGANISEMSDFCMNHRCGVMAELRSSAEIAIANTLAAGVYPLDVDQPGLGGSQRIMLGTSKRYIYTDSTNVSASFMLYDGITPLDTTGMSGTGECIVAENNAGNWVLKMTDCFPVNASRMPFFCQAGCTVPPPRASATVSAKSEPLYGSHAGEFPIKRTYNCMVGVFLTADNATTIAAECLGQGGWNITEIPVCEAATTPEPTVVVITEPPFTTPAWEGTLADAIFLSWAPLEDDALLYSFEFFAIGNGTLDLLVLQPGCTTGTNYCSSSDMCRADCGSVIGNLIAPCDTAVSTKICSLERECEVGGTATCASGLTTYTVTQRFSVTVDKEGYQFYALAAPLAVQKGYIIGFDPSGGSRISWRPALPGETPDYGGLSSSDIFDSSNSGPTTARHYILAHFRNPFAFTIPLKYPGPMLRSNVHGYQFNVGISSNQAGVSSRAGNGSYINVQIPITGFNMSIQPLHVVVGKEATLSYSMLTGSNVTVIYDWGDGIVENVVINNCTNSSFTKTHQYVNEGVYQLRMTIRNEWGSFTWNHTLHAQYPVTDDWKLRDNAPVLVPPGDVTFQCLYPPAPKRLPTAAYAILEYGDGNGTEFNITEGTAGFNHTSIRSFEKKGEYLARIRIWNLASEITIINRVRVYERIINLQAYAKFVPFLPRGGGEYYNGFGPRQNSFPLERNVTFFPFMDQGDVMDYRLRWFVNDTAVLLTNTTDEKINYLFPEPGTYDIGIFAWNFLQGEAPQYNYTLNVLETITGLEITDMGLISEQGTDKIFILTFDQIGTYTCLMIDWGDNSTLHAYTARNDMDIKNFCFERYSNYSFTWMGYIEQKMALSHIYNERGFYKVQAEAYNDLSVDRAVILFPISGIPCAPPDLWIRFNESHYFWSAQKYVKGRPNQLVALGFIDCNITLVTKKEWTVIRVEPSLGQLTDKITNISALASHNKSILSLPPAFLDIGIYQATYTMTILVNENSELDIAAPFQRSVTSYFLIIPTRMDGMLTKGGESFYRRGINQSLALLPLLWSVDPDDARNNQDMTVKWWCHRRGEQIARTGYMYWAGLYVEANASSPLDTERKNLYYQGRNNVTNLTETMLYPDRGGCFGWGPGLINWNDSFLVLNGSQFRDKNIVYEITAEVRKGMRRAYKAIEVEIVDKNPPIIEIGCQNAQMCKVGLPPDNHIGMRFNPSIRTALIADCVNFCVNNATLSWSWSLSIVDEFGIEEQLDITEWAVGYDTDEIALSKFLYSNYSLIDQFRVSVEVTTEDGEVGKTAMYLFRNQPPDALCYVQPPKGKILSWNETSVDAYTTTYPYELGVSLLDDYILNCTNYTDLEDDVLGRYVLIGRPMAGIRYSKQLRYGRERESRFVLPFGDWELYVQVHDGFGAFTEIPLANVSVRKPTPEEYEKWEDSEEMVRNLGEGDQNRLNQMVFARKLLLDELWPELNIVPTTTEIPWTTTIGTTETPATTIDPFPGMLDQQAAKINKDVENVARQNFYFEQMQSINFETVSDCVQLFGSLESMIGDGTTTNVDGRTLATKLLSGDCITKTLASVDLSDPEEVSTMVESMLCAMTALLKSTARMIMKNYTLPAQMDWEGLNATEFMIKKASLQRELQFMTTVEPSVMGGGDSMMSTTTTMNPIAAELARMEEAELDMLMLQKERARNDTEDIVKAVEVMQEKLTSILLAAETPARATGECGTHMELNVVKARELGNTSLWIGDGLYEFPDYCILTQGIECDEEAMNQTIGIQAITWNAIIQSFGEGADTQIADSSRNMMVRVIKRFKTWTNKTVEVPHRYVEVLNATYSRNYTNYTAEITRTLEYSTEMIDVFDIAEDINISIPVGVRDKNGNLIEAPTMPAMSFIKPVAKRGDHMVYFQFNVTNPYTGMTVQLQPGNTTSKLAIYVKRFEHPNAFIGDYDFAFEVKGLKSYNRTEQRLEPWGKWKNDTTVYEFPIYNLFVNDEYISNWTGTYWIGVMEFSETADSSSYFVEPKAMNLTWSNITTRYSTNYTIRIFSSGCLFYDSISDSWSSQGCRIIDANTTYTVCGCNHLTNFGSGFFVMPNAIDFDYVFAHAGFLENITIYMTLIVITTTYIILVIWARRKDQKDVEQLGVIPLPDNKPEDKYLYEVLVMTGQGAECATHSKISFILSGETDETDVRTFGGQDYLKRKVFQSAQFDNFVMAVPRPMGELNYLRIWHDNSGKGQFASWYLNFVVFRDLQTGEKYQFISNDWFAVEKSDGLIDRLLPVAGKEQMGQFSHLFQSTSKKNLQDGHLWFSIFMRPPRSRFTRVQRVSSCVALLYLSMLVNAMWYQRTNDDTSAGLKFGPFSLSPEQIGVGIMANLIVFPPSFLIIYLFRNSKRRILRESRIEKAINEQREKQLAERKNNPFVDKKEIPPASAWEDSTKTDDNVETMTDADGNVFHKRRVERKKKFLLPWWCRYIAWAMIIICIGASIFFLFAYGVMFGNEKTAKWLTSLLISFFTSVLVTQPIKVFLLAMMFSAICKKTDQDDDDVYYDEYDPKLGSDEVWLQTGAAVGQRKKRYQPVDNAKLRKMKLEREKEVKMWDIVQEMIFYALFLWILIVLSYGNRDPNATYLRKGIYNSFGSSRMENNFSALQTGDDFPKEHRKTFQEIKFLPDFYNWGRQAFAPAFLTGPSYNGRPPSGNERLYLRDRVNVLLGYALLRQVRIKKSTCRVQPKVYEIFRDDVSCKDFGNMYNEDRKDYLPGWNKTFAFASIPPNLANTYKESYQYKRDDELDGYPVWGTMDWYTGGGYTVRLRQSMALQDMQKVFTDLEQMKWIDERTRAIFLEFSVYNAHVNLFTSVTILVEQGPDGKLLPHMKLNPIRLLFYHEGFGLFLLICEITFIVFIFYYTYREMKELCRDKAKYWSDPWNYMEIIIIGLGYPAAVFYCYLKIMGEKISSRFNQNQGNTYVNLQSVAYIEEVFTQLVAFLVFFATLKFIKLLRFNKRMGMMAATLKQCGKDLMSFFVMMGIVFLAFGFFFYLHLSAHVYKYATPTRAVVSAMVASLGKFDIQEMAEANPILGPTMFFIFALIVIIVLTNLLMTVIIMAFAEVKNDLANRVNEYEMVDFMVNRIKMFVGMKTGKVSIVNTEEEAALENEELENRTTEFPGKVDELLEQVNQMYFRGKLKMNDKDWLKKTLKNTRNRDPAMQAMEEEKNKPRKAFTFEDMDF